MQVMTREIITGLGVLFVLIALLLFVGPAIKNLAVVLMVGIYFGTFTSMFIAAPLTGGSGKSMIGAVCSRRNRSKTRPQLNHLTEKKDRKCRDTVCRVSTLFFRGELYLFSMYLSRRVFNEAKNSFINDASCVHSSFGHFDIAVTLHQLKGAGRKPVPP